ncbi:hypothetical protein L9F63_004680 [Diploptera punctata]|uniref:Uncharacterized protein n=1 Tax=Diploptera punctata TaxID=6984 RepID=A0AAD7ZFG3_DIPPU|nr:hypothetical protein L9F63_004680 [Diploptera punctata]
MLSNCCKHLRSDRVALFLSGLYLWFNALYTILLIEWDYDSTVEFLQGRNSEHMRKDVVKVLLTALQLTCGFQMFTLTFLLIHGVIMRKKGVIVAWLWCHTFQVAVFIVYLFSGSLVYIIMGESNKILLLLFGAVNLLVSICVWRLAFMYVKAINLHEQVMLSRVDYDLEHYIM